MAAQRVTLPELVDRYLAVHTGAESTRRMLRWKLDKALAVFGSVAPAKLTREEVERWSLTIPEGHRSETVQALKQTLRWAGKAGLIERHHPVLDVANPQPRRREVQHFETWADVDALADEIDPRFRALIIFAAGTGLRPGEWRALERRDLDLKSSFPTFTVARRMGDTLQMIEQTYGHQFSRQLWSRCERRGRPGTRRAVRRETGGDHRGVPVVAALAVAYVWRRAYGVRSGFPPLAHDADEWELARLAAFDAESDGRIVDAAEASE